MNDKSKHFDYGVDKVFLFSEKESFERDLRPACDRERRMVENLYTGM